MKISDFDLSPDDLSSFDVEFKYDDKNILELYVPDYSTFDLILSIINKYNDRLGSFVRYYRGVSNKDYDLINSLTVNELVSCESRLISSFYSSSPRDFSFCKSEFEKISLMQHYGLPTRFLDFTKNPLVALWFACQRCNVDSSDSDCAVYVAFSNNLASPRLLDIVCKIATFTEDGLHSNGIHEYLTNDEIKYYLDILFSYPSSLVFSELPIVDQREQNQQALFLVGMNYPVMISFNGQGFNSTSVTQENFLQAFQFVQSGSSAMHHLEKGDLRCYDPKRDVDFLLKIVIPKESKNDCLLQLLIRGITKDFIFPTLDNKAEKIKNDALFMKEVSYSYL